VTRSIRVSTIARKKRRRADSRSQDRLGAAE
jgi:hypothetical protein